MLLFVSAEYTAVEGSDGVASSSFVRAPSTRSN